MGIYAYLIFKKDGKLVGLDRGGEREMAYILGETEVKVKGVKDINSLIYCEESGGDIDWSTVKTIREFFTKVQNKVRKEGLEDPIYIDIIQKYIEILKKHSPEEEVIVSIG